MSVMSQYEAMGGDPGANDVKALVDSTNSNAKATMEKVLNLGRIREGLKLPRSPAFGDSSEMVNRLRSPDLA